MIYGSRCTNAQDIAARFFQECLSYCNGAATAVRIRYSSASANVTAPLLHSIVNFHVARQVSRQLFGKTLLLERDRVLAEPQAAIEVAGSTISLGERLRLTSTERHESETLDHRTDSAKLPRRLSLAPIFTALYAAITHHIRRISCGDKSGDSPQKHAEPHSRCQGANRKPVQT